MAVTIEIPGPPVPKGRPRTRILWLGSVPSWVKRLARAQLYTPEKTREFEKAVAQCGLVAKAKAGVLSWSSFPICVPVVALMTFYMVRPQRPKWPVPAGRPDLDNVEKSVLDGLVAGGVLKDDALIVDKVSRKRYAAGIPMVRVVLRPYELEESEPF